MSGRNRPGAKDLGSCSMERTIGKQSPEQLHGIFSRTYDLSGRSRTA